jgi:nucleotide-binding universal stress UspA family protein
MSTIRRIGPKLFLGGIILAVFLIGWANRYSIAQSRTQDVPPPAAPAERPKEALPQVPAEPVKTDVAAPALPGPGPLGADSPPPLGLKEAPSREPVPIPTSAPAPPPVVVGPDHSPIEAEDPEKVASEFLEQNQKLAEAQLKALKEEAEKLRARLTKVDAGIKRWDRLLVALIQSQGAAAVEKADGERPARKWDAKPPAAPLDEQLAPHTEPGSEVPQSSKPTAPAGDVDPR